MRFRFLSLMFLLVLFIAAAASADPLRTYVSEFAVTGAPAKEELAPTLQGLLASRIDSDLVQLVEGREQAELLLMGSYAQFGKQFSLDLLIRHGASGRIAKVYEQGDDQGDLLPALGRLAQKANRELAKLAQGEAKSSSEAPAAAPRTGAQLAASAPAVRPVPATAFVPTVQTAPAASTAPAAIARVPAAPAALANSDSYLVRKDESAGVAGSPASTPLDGVFTGIALGRTLPGGERELFVAGDRKLRYYREKSGALGQVAEVVLPRPAKILAVDTADLDGDGTPEVYLTVMDRETLTSQVYLPGEKGLEKVAENLPYFFRGIGTDLGTRKIYLQEMGATGEFLDGMALLVKSGARFEIGKREKLPPRAAIFNYNRFSDAAGTPLSAVLDGNGYIGVSSSDGKQLWQGSEKFGGSAAFFTKESLAQQRATGGDQYIWTFLEQRMIQTPGGKLLVPRNEGALSVGNNRAYSRHTLHAFAWSGAHLRELWQSRPDATYLADFAFDPATGEAFLLEVVQKETLFSRGTSQVSRLRVE